MNIQRRHSVPQVGTEKCSLLLELTQHKKEMRARKVDISSEKDVSNGDERTELVIFRRFHICSTLPEM